MPSNYDVGYKKPPLRTRFRKGESGNPKGRPKGTKNFKTDLVEELSELVLVREGTSERRLSKQRAMLKSLTAKAIKGDTRAASIVVGLVHRLLETDISPPDEPLSAEEEEILDAFEARMEERHRQTDNVASTDGQARKS
jgi:hypothetical protein